MALTVTLHVFSGRPDPTWTIPDDKAAAIEEKIASLERPTLSKPPGTLGQLGYRGFSVQGPSHAGKIPLDAFVHEGIVDRGSRFDVNVVDESREIERLLLASAPQLPADVHSHVKAEVERDARIAAPPSDAARPAASQRLLQLPWPWPWPWPPLSPCPPCHAADAPVYNPGKWNVPGVQPYNNCYNYANDHITNTFAQPGRAHGHMYTAFTCPNVQAAAVADGLVATANFTTPLAAGHGWYVALVIWPGNDFHWYRQDKNGCWSHKPGGTAARNTDNSGHTITNPQTANRGPYTNFCTFMVTKNGLVIN